MATSISLNYAFRLPESLQPSTPPFSASAPVAGFGEYQEFPPVDFDAYLTTAKTHMLVQALLLVGASVAVITATAAFPILIWVTPVALITIAVHGVRTYLTFQASLTYFPPDLTIGLNPQDFQAKRVGEYIPDNGPGLVLNNSIESKKYKLDLIRNAQQSIFLSSYMGEEPFDEALDLIKERLEQNRNLKVFILGSNYFLTPENRQRVDHLKTAHPDRFFSVFNSEIYYSEHPKGGRSLFSSNHIKLMAIDQGAYVINGGSALRPYWTDVTGEDHLPQLKLKRGFFDINDPLEAKGFRDMDFAFKSQPGGAGTTAFLEGAKLMLRYAHLENPELAQRIKQQFLEVMQSPTAATAVPSIDNHPQKVDRLGMKLYATGPDHLQNSYLHALIDLINSAKEKIVIGHMFFHPPQSLLDALLKASERGVKIEIITNSKDREAPLAHRFFADLAQKKYQQLFTGAGLQNVKVYEYYRANTTYHKKVVVVDYRYTAFGSSNLGTKSIEENPADYELNSIVDSQAFATKTMDVLKKDITLSNEVAPHLAKNLGWDTRLFAWFQERIMTHFL